MTFGSPWVGTALQLILMTLGLKSLLGFHFPWEVGAKAKKRLIIMISDSRLPSEREKRMLDLLDQMY